MPTSTDPLPTTLSTAIEEDQEPEVINTTDIVDIQDSPHQFPGTTSRHTGQMSILTQTQIDCITKLITCSKLVISVTEHLVEVVD